MRDLDNAGNVAVTDSNPADRSIGVQYVSGSNPVRNSTGTLVGLTAGYNIYYTGEYNAGMYSLGAYFSSPAITGDSFIGGVDRAAAAGR